ncbi:hypothetical protein V6N13_021625 [Hibiscus sabdariffa]
MEFPRFLFYALFFLSISVYLFPTMADALGINYGQIADNLPSPEDVVPIVKSIGATKVKLYDADPTVLKAFANTGVEFVVGLGNEYLDKMRDPAKAQAWVKQNVQSHLPATKITCIFVGNEVLTFNDTSLSENLLPAMQSVHAALVSLGLDKQVTVTTTHSLAILETSYPPSAGAFRQDLVDCLSDTLSFHQKTGSPFLINAYPFFAYKGNPKQVPLEFVLFQPNQGIVDPATNLHYDNMLYAQIDAVYNALATLGYKKLPVHISETGWPSKGDDDEFGATPDNAKKYNGNLIKLMSKKTGTPMRPNSDLNIYVFALFNENLKPGPTSERNYGLFKPDGTPAYSLGISSTNNIVGSNNTTTAGGNIGKPPTTTPPASPTSSSTGYLSISSATERYRDLEELSNHQAMAVVENAPNQDAAASNDQDQSKLSHARSRPDPSFHEDDQGLYNKIGGPHPRTNGGDLRELQELFSKLNPMAEEFVPHSLVNNGLSGGLYTNKVVLQNNNNIYRSGNANGNGAGNRKKNFGQGKRKSNSRTSMAQRDEVVRRTVYVSDIDHQVTEEQLAGLFVSCGQVVDCRICGDPNSVLRFAFIEFTDEEGAHAALSLSGTMLGFYPVRVLPSKTAIAPVNPTFLPRNEDERQMCARTIYCTNIDKKVTQADVKLFFETVCGEVYRLRLLGDYQHSTRIAFVEFVMAESAIAALNCSGVVLGSLPIRVSPSKTPVRPRAPRLPSY